MARLRIKRVMRWSPGPRLFRVARIMWERGTVGDGGGYSAKLSIALRPVLFRYHRSPGREWFLTIGGIRVHYQRAYGGIHA